MTQYNWPGHDQASPDQPLAVRHSDGTKFGALTVDGVGAFGDVVTAELTPLVQIDFVYAGHPDQILEFTESTGNITYDEAMACASTGANIGGTAFLQSNRVVRYRPGQGALFRFTAMFNAPVFGVSQVAGAFGVSENGLQVGYDFTDEQLRLGFVRQAHGVRHIHTLEMTAAASGSETYTITLDGVEFEVPLTAGTLAENANEIAEFTFTGWLSEADGDKVYFLSNRAQERPGAFSESSTGTAAGTLSETLAGVSAESNWVYQEDWNHDKFDGTGPSGQTIDPQKLNVFQIRMQYLGAGAIEFGIEDSDTGRFVCAHRVPYANLHTKPSSSNPTYAMGMAVSAVTVAADVTLKMASLGGFVEGKRKLSGPSHGGFSQDSASVATPVLSIRNNQIFANGISRANLRDVFPTILSASGSGSNRPIVVTVLLNAELTDPLWANYSDPPIHSFVSVDRDATAFSGGDVVFVTGFVSGSGRDFNLSDVDLDLMPGDTLTIVITPTGTPVDYIASLAWREDS